ncbi:Zinc finger/thioredoxin putative [Moraxella macacae 0408225]|uniref:Zinc finger/thioredoxin putative n=1 Tax=Moraxella macacae 0408225 TaxID=1230338 RepID=L2F5L8_9GAMM|nr:DUF3426 domain-containing protein [Moraxella macacae]ELA08327.1 Zinc finger/thioredoxin putative [Moraxella macacae 0408225]
MSTQQTQCPNCQHTFGITDEQLNLKSGYARCGNCKVIFSAIDNLTSLAKQAQTKQAITPDTKTTQNPPNQTKPVKRTKKAPADGDLTFDDNTGLGQEADPDTNNNQNLLDDLDIIDNFDNLPINKIAVATTIKTEDDEDWLAHLLEEEKRREEAIQYMPDNDKLTKVGHENTVVEMLNELGVDVAYEQSLESNEYHQRLDERFSAQVASQKNIKKPIGMTLVWAVGSLLLIGLLVVQYTVFNLDNLLKNPDNAKNLQQVCTILKCTLPTANVSLLAANTLKLEKTKNNKQTDLIFTLKNGTNQKMIYPNLKISLRNGNDIKAQTIVTPKQYLDDDGYLMPKQIRTVKLRIDYPKFGVQQANIEPFY